MRLLFDTSVALHLLRATRTGELPAFVAGLIAPSVAGFVSAATLWEIAIKTRLGKLDPGMPLQEMTESLRSLNLTLLDINEIHAITPADPEPPTRDPFDRLLLAQCQVEGLKLVTQDRALMDHPLALKA